VGLVAALGIEMPKHVHAELDFASLIVDDGDQVFAEALGIILR
jgi:hypothetical protein